MNKGDDIRIFGPRIAKDCRTIFVDEATNKIQQDSGVFAARKGDKATAIETRKKILDSSNSVIEFLVEKSSFAVSSIPLTSYAIVRLILWRGFREN